MKLVSIAEVQLILCKNTFFSSHRQTSWIILMQIAQTVPQIINLPQIPRICTDYFPCGGTRIYFEHEICRRPTDQREVISQISRIHNIHPRNFDGSKLLPQQQKICENPCNLWETLSKRVFPVRKPINLQIGIFSYRLLKIKFNPNFTYRSNLWSELTKSTLSEIACPIINLSLGSL